MTIKPLSAVMEHIAISPNSCLTTNQLRVVKRDGKTTQENQNPGRQSEDVIIEYDSASNQQTETVVAVKNRYALDRRELYWPSMGERVGQLLLERFTNGLKKSNTLKVVMIFTFVLQVFLPVSTKAQEIPKTDGVVNQIYKDQFGRYIVAGDFSTVDGIPAHNIAMREKGTWRNLGAGTDGSINTVVVASNGEVIIGGNFKIAGGVWVNHIAKWNGESWAALGIGTNRMVKALRLDSNGRLFVFGEFTLAGGEIANAVAVWNGDRWLTDARAEELCLEKQSWMVSSGYCGRHYVNTGRLVE